MKENRIFSIYLVAAVLWAVFTVSLAAWWVIFGFQLIDALGAIQGAEALARKHRMLLWEGLVLMVLLLGGGVALGYFIIEERKQRQAIKRFLATFTHELKTPIASLRLQAEALREEVSEPGAQKLIDRLVSDTSRLTLQLENSLQLAEASESLRHSRPLVVEPVLVSEFVATLHDSWPMLVIEVQGDAEVLVDRRALASIAQNIIQNAVSHGQATRVSISAESAGEGRVRLIFADNGKGLTGDPDRLGILFSRFSSKSGSGIGLYLVKKLAEQMDGKVEFGNVIDGFSIQVQLRGSVQAV